MLEILPIVRYPTACASKGKAGSHDERITYLICNLAGALHIVGDAAIGYPEPDTAHCGAKEVPVFGLFDHLCGCRDHFDTKPFEHACFGNLDSGVQGSLSAQGGQKCVRPLLFKNLDDRLRRNGLDVGMSGHLGVGHDGCRVAVYQDDLIAFLFEGLTGLNP